MKKHKGLVIYLVVILFATISLGIFLVWSNCNNVPAKTSLTAKGGAKIVIPELKIIDKDSDSRNYAFMINNHPIARKNHAGLDDAHIVYEAIVEGGLTRLMAIFKDKTTTKIGSIRSSRHDFLDYALENDAIYVHFGWSPQAQSDIKSLGINNMNGLYDSGYWRDYSLGVALEHTAFTSMENMQQLASKKGYRITTTQEPLLNYSIFPVFLSKREDAVIANNVNIPYSYYVETSYTYDSEKQVYLRSVNGQAHMNLNSDGSKTQIEVKNIIIANMNNYSIDNYGRQEIENIGSGTGYYITDGYAVPITWTKNSRQEQTIYKYMDGSEIKVNDGNTYIQLYPLNQTVTITE